MKSLKRTLSLVLVLVMILGLVGAASATSYSDDAKIQYKEAVDVMTGIGAIEGMGGNTFDPTGPVTRAQAAKMVAYTLLNKGIASSLSGVDTNFKDVTPAFAWAIPSIQYLVSIGAINGRGDGTFDPNGQVTAYEIGKMLLVGLGYGKNSEYIGNDWTLNVAIDANRAGIFAGRLAGANPLEKAANREECALYCFNTIANPKAALVAYNKLTDQYDIKTTVDEDDKIIAQTLMNTVYPTLARLETSNDAFGRPAVKWTYGAPAKTIALATSAPILSYTTAFKPAALKVAIENAGYKLGTTLDLYRNNGTPNDTFNAAQLAAYIAANVSEGGNGTVIEIYGDATTGIVTRMVVVSTYAGLASITKQDDPATTSVDERAITVTLNGATPVATIALGATVPGFDAVFTAATAAAAAGKTLPVLVTPNGDNPSATTALTVAAATTATVVPTSFSASGFTADGKNYLYSDNFKGNAVTGFASVDVFLDAYGHVIYCNATAAATTNYAILTSIGTIKSGIVDVPAAELIVGDGSKVAAPYTNTGSAVLNDIVTYINTNGVYAVTNANATDVAASTLTLTKGKAAFTWNSTTYYANAATLFFIRNGAGTPASPYTYAAYTGIANVPSLTGSVAGQIILTGTTAKVVYLQNPNETGASGDVVFVPSLTPVSTQTYPTYTVYTYAAVVNGAVGTIKCTTAVAATGVYPSCVTDTNGITTLAGTAIAPTGGSVSYAGGNLVYGTSQLAAAATCPVFVFSNSAATLTQSSLAGLNGISVIGYCIVPNTTQTQAVAVFAYVA